MSVRPAAVGPTDVDVWHDEGEHGGRVAVRAVEPAPGVAGRGLLLACPVAGCGAASVLPRDDADPLVAALFAAKEKRAFVDPALRQDRDVAERRAAFAAAAEFPDRPVRVRLDDRGRATAVAIAAAPVAEGEA